MSEIKTEFQAWLKTEDYDKGIQMLSKYHRNKTMVRILSMNPNPSKADKLLYELANLAGLPKVYLSHSKLIQKAAGKVPAETIAPPVKGKAKGGQKPKPKSKKEDSPAGNLKFDVPFNKLPLIIQEITKQKGKLFREREKLHDQLADEAIQDNKPDNVSLRAVIGEKVDHISERIEALYAAEQAYKKNKALPSEDFVYKWNPEPVKKNDTKFPDLTKLSDVELANRKTNLRTYLTKDENMLNFQSKATKKEADPMPSGPKRDKLERKIAAQKLEIKAIEEELKKRAGKS